MPLFNLQSTICNHLGPLPPAAQAICWLSPICLWGLHPHAPPRGASPSELPVGA
ncbi:MAG: hypothetical protein MUD01_03170 [Chloroflexaceae bacterium]|nr:hypothetical protein [Chloroflexaceae bacterium]